MTDTFLSAHWENLIMANYAVDPDVLKPYLPHGVELDFYNSETYLSLVGFMFKQTKLFGIPIPFFGTFEEINLRFYVKRITGNSIKRGVVFINETVPYKIVAWLANRLYKENYVAIPTKNSIAITSDSKNTRFEWKSNKLWNHIAVSTYLANENILPDSIEEFIFEHYYGYTRINNKHSQEYKVDHPQWQVNKVKNYSIHCDFKGMYGKDFSFLNDRDPTSVVFAEGSAVTVKWERTSF